MLAGPPVEYCVKKFPILLQEAATLSTVKNDDAVFHSKAQELIAVMTRHRDGLLAIADRLKKHGLPVTHEACSITAALCRRRNSLLPISRLPPEVLKLVFEAVRNGRPAHRWYKISHVCHHWRIAMLGDPTLWTHLDYERVKMARWSCIIAKDLPLTVDLVHENIAVTVMRKALQELPRFRALTVSCATEDHRCVLRNALQQDAPMLVKLNLDSCGALPSEMLGKEANSLSQLQITNGIIPWSALCFTNLTSLVLRKSGNAAFTWSSIYSFFMTASSLERVVLDQYLGNASGIVPQGTLPIHLKQLREVKITEERAEMISHLLAMVRPRDDSDLFVAADDMFETTILPVGLACVCRAALKASQWRRMEIAEDYAKDSPYRAIELQMTTSQTKPDVEYVPGRLVLRGRFTSIVTVKDLLIGLVLLAGKRCLAQLEHLTVGLSTPGTTWDEIFQCAPLHSIETCTAVAEAELNQYLRDVTDVILNNEEQKHLVSPQSSVLPPYLGSVDGREHVTVY